jgi:predicted transcriptional regulator
VPNVEGTPRRTIRVPDELWEAVKRIAKDRRETVTEVVIRALTQYVRNHPYDD